MGKGLVEMNTGVKDKTTIVHLGALTAQDPYLGEIAKSSPVPVVLLAVLRTLKTSSKTQFFSLTTTQTLLKTNNNNQNTPHNCFN